MSAQQLAWLEEELRGCAAAGERVLVACHLAFHPNTCPPACLLWNYTEVLQVGCSRLERSKSAAKAPASAAAACSTSVACKASQGSCLRKAWSPAILLKRSLKAPPPSAP